jgi:sugar phosphate isomerase/epimerase
LDLGLVTYNLAKDWSLEKIIDLCSRTGFKAVELRTTHAHGIEPNIGIEERYRVRELFENSPVRLLSFGTVCEYHSIDENEVRRNIELTRAFIKLAYDTGALGVKVRPNRLMEDHGIPREKTLKQIGEALKVCGEYGEEYGVGWNSNPTDIVDGSISWSFNLLREWVRSVHIHELYDESYPYRELFTLLRSIGYQRYCLAEIPESPEPERIMRYYRALWNELTRV